jgi:hypothetical protein
MYAVVEVWLHTFTSALDGGCGQVHTSNTLSVEKEPLVPIG